MTRASGKINPDYKVPYSFVNDFSTFSLDAPRMERNDPFEKVASNLGECKVICFSPDHDKTLAELSLSEIESITKLWKNEFINLKKNLEIKNILIFENKGKEIGVSNPHPHGQIYATGFIPKIVQTQVDSFNQYQQEHKNCLLCDLLKNEQEKKHRIILENDSLIAFVPFFARFPYETYLVPKRHVLRIDELSDSELKDLSKALSILSIKFDNLFKRSFPNITILQNAPVNSDVSNYHFHMEFYPPLREADKLKYLAGFESGAGNIINPLLPENAAELLRNSSETHFKLC